jgi:hypothetical protein
VLVLDETVGGFRLEGTHDGFDNLAGRPRHIRRFEAGARGLSIADRIEGKADRFARIGFLLHPDVSILGEGRHLELARAGARVTMACSHPLVREPAVWWPDIGCEMATTRLVMTLPLGALRATAELSITSARNGDG